RRSRDVVPRQAFARPLRREATRIALEDSHLAVEPEVGVPGDLVDPAHVLRNVFVRRRGGLGPGCQPLEPLPKGITPSVLCDGPEGDLQLELLWFSTADVVRRVNGPSGLSSRTRTAAGRFHVARPAFAKALSPKPGMRCTMTRKNLRERE